MNSSMRLLALVCAVLILGGCATTSRPKITTAPKGLQTGFLNRTLVRSDGTKRPYVVYVPRDYTPDKAWPLILFLHGAGERGDDGLIQTEVGIGRAIRRWSNRFPCIVVMPQCPRKVWWNKAEEDIDLALSQTRAEFNIDNRRIYLTGLSMGGFATWIYGAQHTNTFAALMPICGGGRESDAEKLAKTPIWAFHGAADSVVSPEMSRKMVKAVEEAGGTAKYTEYPGVNHNSWDKAYADPKAIKWMLSQELKPGGR